MTRRSLASLALMTVALSAPIVACSVSNAVEAQEAPVIHGEHEAGRPAVVSLLMERPGPSYATCTGTIIATNPATKVGYVLTAAHCVRDTTNVYVTEGADTAQASGLLRYQALDFKAHPSYDNQTSSPYDVAVVRIVGASAATPVIPMAQPDSLAVGTAVTSVGFGRTIRPNEVTDAGGNTQKNRIDGIISQLSSTQIAVRYADGGDICQGDSGGPVLVTANGREYVVGVHSFVTGPCVGDGYSVRASAHAAFIKSILDEAEPAPSCQVCRKTLSSGTEVCAQARDTCANDPQCDGLRKCLSRCSANTADAGDAGSADECRKACSAEFPFGAGPYNTLLVFCSCKQCGDTCAADDACKALPKCGMKGLGSDSCNSCLDGACCDAQAACGADGHCYRCTRNPETPGCDADPLYQALTSCQATHCTAACAEAGTP